MKNCRISSFLQTLGEWLQSPFLLALRLYWGYQFLLSGWGKLQAIPDIAGYFAKLGIPLPYVNAYIAGSIELLGGLLLILGLFSRIAAFFLITVMIVAYATAHPEALHDMEEFIKASPFSYLMCALIVFLFGPGKISLDALWCKKK